MAAAILAFIVHVRWRVPALSAARRRAILNGRVSLDSPAGPRVSSAVAVDWGFPGRAATLVVFDDDTVILYLYPRAAILGSTRIRRLEDVVIAGNALRAALGELAHFFAEANDFLLPRPGELTFYLIDPRGTRAAGPAAVREIQGSNHQLRTAERLATRLLALVCGTVPAVVPGPLMSLVTEDRPE